MLLELVKKVQEDPQNYSPEDVANEILLTINYTENSPVPIVDIAQKMGFSVRTINELKNNDSGYILISHALIESLGTDKAIVISKKIKYGKARFVLAHEIGHFLFDYAKNDNNEFSHIYTYNSVTKDTDKEKRVNEFAANLLMPKKLFVDKYTKYIKEYNNENQTIFKLARVFELTPKSIQKRINELNLTREQV